MDEEFSGRIKNFEAKLKGTIPLEKKPRDLLRAIGLYIFFYIVLYIKQFIYIYKEKLNILNMYYLFYLK